MRPFPVQILAADHPFYEGDCRSLVVPTLDGMYGIQVGHSNLITVMIPGRLQYRLEEDGPLLEAAVSGGLVKVEDGSVLILADAIERPEEIDLKRAQRDADAAREALLQKRSIQEYHAAQANLARALNRLQVKRHSRMD